MLIQTSTRHRFSSIEKHGNSQQSPSRVQAGRKSYFSIDDEINKDGSNKKKQDEDKTKKDEDDKKEKDGGKKTSGGKGKSGEGKNGKEIGSKRKNEDKEAEKAKDDEKKKKKGNMKKSFAEITKRRAILDLEINKRGNKQIYMGDRYDIEFACLSSPISIRYVTNTLKKLNELLTNISKSRKFKSDI